MYELWNVILTSTVVATIISGIVSIVVSYMQYNGSLNSIRILSFYVSFVTRRASNASGAPNAKTHPNRP